MEFDIILGMDLLSTSRASMNCYGKKVTIRIDEILEFTIKEFMDIEHQSYSK